jgi:hypothetical protein
VLWTAGCSRVCLPIAAATVFKNIGKGGMILHPGQVYQAKAVFHRIKYEINIAQ